MGGSSVPGGRPGGWEEKARIIERYDRLSSVYDELYGEEQGEKHDSALRALGSARGLALDVGCGTGSLFAKLAGAFEVVGVDISIGMLRAAKGKGGGAHLIRADAEYLPLRDGIFDALFCFTVFSNPMELGASIPELGRVLKPNAALVLSAPKGAFDPGALLEILGPLGECELVDCETRDHICICRLGARLGGAPRRPLQDAAKSAIREAAKAERRTQPRGPNGPMPRAELA
jgi:SAM-dependent methyltransferase